MVRKVGFIGFGRVVKWHLKQIKDVDIEVEFILDISKEKIKEAKSVIKNSKYFLSFEDLFIDKESCNVDYIVVATPSGSHYEVGKLLSSKTSATLIFEKPVFLDSNHYLDSETWGNKIIPIFQNRYNESVVKAFDVLKSGSLGKLLYASLSLDWIRPQRYYDQASWRGTWANDGGVSTNQGIHYFDITRHLLGDFKKVNAYMKRIAVNIECEDYLCAFFEMNNGLPLDVRMTTAMRGGNEEASLTINGTKGRLNLYGVCCNKLSLEINDHPKGFFGGDVEIAYGYGHKTFYKILTGENKNQLLKLSTMDEAYKTMKFIFSCYASALRQCTSFVDDDFSDSPLGKKQNESIQF